MQLPCPPDGSSPRMRGTRQRHQNDLKGRRFIPAYAGNTFLCARNRLSISVHPRVCGEHGQLERGHDTGDGSSPRMRGTRDLLDSHLRDLRFIPAYAGNTERRSAIAPHRPVHPRVCGEHPVPALSERDMVGSSPRMRGTRFDDSVGAINLRFIPAYAGNTPERAARALFPSVHPRVCGEHVSAIKTT